MNYICSKRMKKALPLWLEYKSHDDLTIDLRGKLLTNNPATIDCLLTPIRARQKNGPEMRNKLKT